MATNYSFLTSHCPPPAPDPYHFTPWIQLQVLMHYPWIYTILPPIHPALHIQNRIPKTLPLHYSPLQYPLLRPDSSTILTQLTCCMSPLGTTISSHMISPNLLGLAFIQDGPLLACYFPLVLHQFKSLLHLWCANQFQLSPYSPLTIQLEMIN